MAALFIDLAGYFKLEAVDIDNWTFKLYSKATVGLFVFSSVISVATGYFGDPIKCLHKEDKSYEESYCWLHGLYLSLIHI